MDQLIDERLPQLATEIAQMRGELRDGLALLRSEIARHRDRDFLRLACLCLSSTSTVLVITAFEFWWF